MLSANEKIVTVMERTLNLVDRRLVDHGRRVAYRVFRQLRPLETNDRTLRDITVVALLHDIGAYKTEDVDNILGFDSANYWGHSIYGYLFLKYFSPLGYLAPVVLFHHADVDKASALCKNHNYVASLINDSDTRAINGVQEPEDDYEAFGRLFVETPFIDDEIESYLRMIVYFIDFRSPQTLLHTFAASFVAERLAVHLGYGPLDVRRVCAGALLHDIGKMGTPIRILESTSNRLTEADMKVMKHHIVHSREILSGCVPDDVFNMAVNHHERLNGKGYPLGLDSSQLSETDGIVAVADLLSAMSVNRSYQAKKPKDEVVKILQGMKANNLLHAVAIDAAVDCYNDIARSLEDRTRPVGILYDHIQAEYVRLHQLAARGAYERLAEEALEDPFVCREFARKAFSG